MGRKSNNEAHEEHAGNNLMGDLVEIVTPLHQMTNRNYLQRMMQDKVGCMELAKKYEFDYWDGDRRYGYGGYKYIEGRWKSVAEKLIQKYSLASGSRVLDVGCGKGFLLYEMQKINPKIELIGFDISEHGLKNSHAEFKGSLFKHKAQDPFPFGDMHFDLVISLGVLHNLRLSELEGAFGEIERVGKSKFVMMESYRNDREMFNLQCWALTAETIIDHSQWIWLFNKFSYTGDYEFIYFE